MLRNLILYRMSVFFQPTPSDGRNLFQVTFQRDGIPVRIHFYSLIIMQGRVGNFVLKNEFGNYDCNFSFCFVNEFDGQLKSMRVELYVTPSFEVSGIFCFCFY